MFKKILSGKSVLIAALLAFGFTSAQPELTHAQSVDIPPCPSADQFPKPGCFDPKDKKEKKEDKSEDKSKKKPKKS